MRKTKFKTSAIGCRVVQKELVDQPPSHLNILLRLLKELPKLVGLEVVELKGRKVLPFD